jgi:hypothetical protein
MYLFLDSNYHNALAYGGCQIGSVFPENVQRNANYCYDRAATISQISYRLHLQPLGQRAAIVFRGFENFCTGARSSVQLSPLAEMKTELTSYVLMIMDILSIYPLVTVYILPLIFRTMPAWFSSSYEEMLPIFLCVVSHIDLDRVLVVPPLYVTSQDLDFDGVHLKPASLQRVLDLLLETFRYGVFVKPDDYPISESISKLEICFYPFVVYINLIHFHQ